MKVKDTLDLKNIKEIELFSLAQSKDKKSSQLAIDLIFENYKHHIEMLAKKYSYLGLSTDDLISESSIGLLKAIERFDVSKETSFKTYSTLWIKQSILRAIDNQSRTIRIPCKSASQIRKYHATHTEMKEKLQREPTRKELAEKLNCTEDVLHRISTANIITCSLNAKSNNSDKELEYVIPNTNDVTPACLMMQKDASKFFKNHINDLQPNENTVIKMRFGLGSKSPKTLQYISDKLGFSVEKIRQIEIATIRKLKSLIQYDIDKMELLMVS